MPRISFGIAAAAALLVCVPALAGTLQCTKINGNLNCAGSGGVSCQTVNGRTVCTNASHDAVQSFGGATADDTTGDDDTMDDFDATPHGMRSFGH
jgi:hypothetical protein